MTTIDGAWELVREFHRAAGQPVGSLPMPLARERLEKRARWMREEIEELELAQDLEGQVDALVDLMYFALGTLVELGVKPEICFEIVHRANMRKVGGGQLVRHPDGKSAKPPGWYGPEDEMREALAAQCVPNGRRDTTTSR